MTYAEFESLKEELAEIRLDGQGFVSRLTALTIEALQSRGELSVMQAQELYALLKRQQTRNSLTIH
jgi:hypothetical protein